MELDRYTDMMEALHPENISLCSLLQPLERLFDAPKGIFSMN